MFYRFSDDHGATWTERSIALRVDSSATLDVAVDSTEAPAIVVLRDRDASSFGELALARWTGSAWTVTPLDAGTRECGSPRLAFGFADRPHVVCLAYQPDGRPGCAVRHAFHGGARRVYENVETGVASFGAAADAYAHLQLELGADDSVRVAYTRHVGTTRQFAVATRGPLGTDVWRLAPVTDLPADFFNPVYLPDVSSAAVIVTNELRIYRRRVDGTFVPSAIARSGAMPAAVVLVRRVAIAYSSREPSTGGRLYLTLATP